jgi:hypothetical protein
MIYQGNGSVNEARARGGAAGRGRERERKGETEKREKRPVSLSKFSQELDVQLA